LHGRAAERLKSFGDARLIHVSDAKIVQSDGGVSSSRPLGTGQAQSHKRTKAQRFRRSAAAKNSNPPN
jgi:hypothetical protein